MTLPARDFSEKMFKWINAYLEGFHHFWSHLELLRRIVSKICELHDSILLYYLGFLFALKIIPVSFKFKFRFRLPYFTKTYNICSFSLIWNIQFIIPNCFVSSLPQGLCFALYLTVQPPWQHTTVPICRAGHFRYFLIFSIIKNDFVAFFIKFITYFCTSHI